MAGLPGYLLQQLAANRAPDDHPDADLLSAFGEGSLAGRERSTVIAHLSACADCRETVMLALPELPATVPAGWQFKRHLPLLRWGALATALSAVAVAALLLLPGRQKSPVYLARSASVAVASPAERPPMDAENPALAGGREQRQHPSGFGSASAMTRLLLRDEQAKAKAMPSQVDRLQAAAPSGNRAQANIPAAADASTAAAETSTAAADASAAAADTSPAAAPAAATRANVVAPARADVAAAKRAPQPLWMLRDGAVVRSEDGGGTWHPASATPAEKLSALAAVASELWVAAPGRVLYHSADGGTHWEPLVPEFAGASPRGEIVGLEFDDARRGRMSLSEGETWSTSDGGHSWQKQ